MSETTDESKRNRRTAKRILAIGLPLVLIAGTGLGYAYWTTSAGSGSGSATAAPGLTPVTLSGSISGLVPGATVDVPVMAKNTNPSSAVHVNSIAIPTGAVPTSNSTTTGLTACDAVSSATATVTPAGAVNVPPTPTSGAGSGGTQVGVLHITLPDDPGVNQDDCKNKIFTVTLVSS